jgi:hypothetical protein
MERFSSHCVTPIYIGYSNQPEREILWRYDKASNEARSRCKGNRHIGTDTLHTDLSIEDDGRVITRPGTLD